MVSPLLCGGRNIWQIKKNSSMQAHLRLAQTCQVISSCKLYNRRSLPDHRLHHKQSNDWQRIKQCESWTSRVDSISWGVVETISLAHYCVQLRQNELKCLVKDVDFFIDCCVFVEFIITVWRCWGQRKGLRFKSTIFFSLFSTEPKVS